MNPLDQTGSRLEIFLNGRGLGDLDFFSKSDPYVKVYFQRKQPNGQWNYMGKSQTIDNDLNPNWNKTFILDYVFQSTQPVRFQVFDDDGGNDELIGSVETTLGALAGAKCQTSMLNLMNNNKNMGKLIVRCEKIQQCSEFLIMKWRAEKLINTDSIFDWWNKSDPYLKFLKIRSDNSYISVAQTQVVDNSLNPNWKKIEVPFARLAANKETKFKIECWDEEPQGKPHQFIGEIFLTLDQLKPGVFNMFNSKHKKPGKLILENFQLVERPSFIDYLRSGLQLNLITAIDFTGSNGSPHAPASLHYMSPHSLNQYQTAIRAVGQILLNYDSDKLIPSFGFGAKPKYPNFTQTVAHHCFPLSGDFENIDAESMNHLEQLYSKAVMSVQFAGPTLFHPLMTEAFKLAEICRNQGSDCYQILLILTDGQIHDMEQTVNLICANGHLPISIIIVGVGTADFTNMKRLDGDEGLYNSKGQKAPRDIVQFVPFREMNNNPRRLAAELLAELPNQVVQYMSLIGKKPGAAKNMDFNQLLQSEMKRKDAEAVDNMFKQGGFFDKFMPQQNQGQGQGFGGPISPVKPMMASYYDNNANNNGPKNSNINANNYNTNYADKNNNINTSINNNNNFQSTKNNNFNFDYPSMSQKR